jgi:elongation factor Ts
VLTPCCCLPALHVTGQIVEGRLEKIKRAYALLEQPALRDNNKTVAEIIKEAIAATGENIQVRYMTVTVTWCERVL